MRRFIQVMILTLVQVFVVSALGAGAAAKVATDAQAKAATKSAAAKKDVDPIKPILESSKKDIPSSKSEELKNDPTCGPQPVLQERAEKDAANIYRCENQSYQKCIRGTIKPSAMSENTDSCLALINPPSESEKTKSCREKQSAVNKAVNEFNDSCKNSGLGGECKETVKECYDNQGSKEFATLGAAASVFGLQGVEDLDKKCPTMTHEKWETSHSKIEDKMNKAKTDLVDSKEKVQKATKQYNETNSKLSKEYNDLNKEQARRALEVNSEKRKASADAQESIRKVQDAQFNNSMKLQEQEQLIVSINIEKAAKLAEGSAAIAKYKCSSDLPAKLKQMGSTSASNFSNMMSGGSPSKTLYKNCITAFLAGREAMIQQYENKLEVTNKMIVHLTETQKNLEDALKTVTSMAEAAKADMSKADQDAQADYLARTKEIQTQMQSNYTESVASLKILNENQQRLEQDVTRASNSFLSSNSNAPETGASTTFKESSSKFGRAQSAKQEALDACGGCAVDSPLSKMSMYCKDGKPVDTAEDLGGSN